MPTRRPDRSAGPMVFGSVGVLALTLTAVVIAASVTSGPEAATPAEPGTGPRATSTSDPSRSADPGTGEPAEVTPPSPRPPDELRLGNSGGTGIRLAAAERALVDLRRMRRSDTRARLRRNPIYATGVMRAMNCRAPRPSTRPAAMNRFLHAVTNCLDRAWATKFSQARALFLKPRRIYYTRGGRGPCGTYPSAGAAAYYCPSNRGMYIGLSHVISASSRVDPARNHVVYLALLAHEYGHHVQSMAGIGGAWWWEVADKSRAVQDAYSRRNELQAQCLSGVFSRSVRSSLGVTSSLWQETLQNEYGRGDDQNNLGRRDHGTGEHYAAWMYHGYRYARISYCNTWMARASDVS